jgi:hypothetical protein
MTTYIPPTVLYIKQHSITGLKYFGKTTRDPLKYNGSGKHWIRHIKKHGRKYIITTHLIGPFTDAADISEFALFFSEEFDIVDSDLWANMKPENGLDGGSTNEGTPHSTESKQKISDANIGIPKSDEHKQKISEAKTGKASPLKGIPSGKKGIPKSDETKQNMRKPQKLVECPHCGKIGGNTMKRYHFDNCKKKIIP